MEKSTPRGERRSVGGGESWAVRLNLGPLQGVLNRKVYLPGPVPVRVWVSEQHVNVLWTTPEGIRHGCWLKRDRVGKTARKHVLCPVCGRRVWVVWLTPKGLACRQCSRILPPGKDRKWGYRQPRGDAAWMRWLLHRAGRWVTRKGGTENA